MGLSKPSGDSQSNLTPLVRDIKTATLASNTNGISIFSLTGAGEIDDLIVGYISTTSGTTRRPTIRVDGVTVYQDSKTSADGFGGLISTSTMGKATSPGTSQLVAVGGLMQYAGVSDNTQYPYTGGSGLLKSVFLSRPIKFNSSIEVLFDNGASSNTVAYVVLRGGLK